MDKPSTRQMAALLRALGVNTRKVLLLTDAPQENVHKSGRNIPKLAVRDAASASTFDLLNAQVILLQEGALTVLTSVLGG